MPRLTEIKKAQVLRPALRMLLIQLRSVVPVLCGMSISFSCLIEYRSFLVEGRCDLCNDERYESAGDESRQKLIYACRSGESAEQPSEVNDEACEDTRDSSLIVELSPEERQDDYRSERSSERAPRVFYEVHDGLSSGTLR